MEKNNNYQDKVKDWHNKHAKEYTHEIDSRTKMLYNHIKNKTVLNIGSGTGSDTFPLAHKAQEIIGIDFSKEMIKQANLKNKHKNVKFIEANINKMPFRDNTFDIAYSISTLYYIKDLPKALKEIHRVLKPGGKALLEIGNSNSINALWDKIMFKVPQFHHTPTQAMHHIFDAGFKTITNIHYYKLHPYTNKEVFNKTLQQYAFRIVFEVTR